MKSYAESTTSYIIIVKGTISNGTTGGRISVKSNKSIIGEGSTAFLSGVGLEIRDVKNIIIQNLKISLVGVSNPGSVNGGDCIVINGTSKNVWIDHCEIFSEDPSKQTDIDKYDGLIDIRDQTGFITVSWCYIHDHHKACLVGASDDDLYADRKVTYHHNYFKNIIKRMPMYRGATGHFFNNYIKGTSKTEASFCLANTCLRIEKNVYETVNFLIYTNSSGTKGNAERIDNIGSQSRAYPPSCKANIPYDYSKVLISNTADVKTIVPQYAGVGKIGTVVTPDKPKKYIYNYDNSGNLSWTNTNSWSPKAVPAKIDTVIIRTGEVQITDLNHTAPITVEANGILRLVNGNSASNEIRLQGGTLKVFTSNPEFALTSNIKVEAPSVLMAGSAAATVFTLNGTITGNYDLTKTSVGVLRVNSTANNFKGNWIVSEGKLQVRSVNGLGTCGVQVKSGARLDIEATGASIYSLKIENTGGIDLDKDFSTDVAVFGDENVLSGSYTSNSRPSFIGSSGKVTVKSSLLSYDGNTVLCPGMDLKLVAASGTSYVWKRENAQVGTGSNHIAVLKGTYGVIVTNENGCKVTSATVSVSEDPCTVTDIKDVSALNEVKAYPNPFTDNTAICYPGQFNYQVFDSKGALIMVGNANNKAEIGYGLNKGLYLIKVFGDSFNSTVFIIKE
ncbi:MAG: T9SS type A sorting domain-containing protein [Sporocytophaga sp.]|nr:T9SS type A sorting domain-containing protein [Sporocytophaga sp.]